MICFINKVFTIVCGSKGNNDNIDDVKFHLYFTW